MIKWLFISITCLFSQNNYEGIWKGVLSDRKKDVSLIFHIHQTNNSFVATMDHIEEGYTDIPLSISFEVEQLILRLDIGTPFTFTGKILTNKKQISGIIKGEGWESPLQLKRIKKAPKIQKPTYELSQDESLDMPILENHNSIFNSKKLEDLIQEVKKVEGSHSFLVYQNGKLVTENYFNGVTKQHKVNIKSVSKSILSILTGIAIEKGFIKSIDEPIHTYFKDYYKDINTPEKFNITIKHLLTMTADFNYSENTYPDTVLSSNDWVKATLNLPMRCKPGEHGMYATPVTHLLAVLISRASGLSLYDFAKKYLFEPLEIHDVSWGKDPQGNYFGGSEVFMTSRQLAKIGILVLNNGVFKNRQIVSESWIKSATKNQLHVSEKITWLDKIGYGYLWYPESIEGVKIISAKGFGGQYMILIPKYDLLIITTANSRRLVNEETRSRLLYSLATKGVFKSLKP